MDRNDRRNTAPGAASPPSRAWLFAQALLGNPVPSPASANAESRANRELLEWLAKFSTEHASQLRRLASDEAEARRQREQLEWLAKISTEHASQLRGLQRAEADARDAQQYWEKCFADSTLHEAQWDPAKHPRGAFSQNLGWWSPTSGSDGGQSASNTVRPIQAVYNADEPKTKISKLSAEKPQQGTTSRDPAPPPGSVATKPQLPADFRGTWIEGTKGHGTFRYNNSAENIKAGIAGKEIRFENQHIAVGGFPAEDYYGGSAENATVEIKDVKGTSVDNDAADAAMREKLKQPTWQRPKGYVWNHAGSPGSKTLELVDADVHAAVGHKGPAAEPRALGRLAKGQVMGRALGVLTVYLTVRDVLRAAGALQPDYTVSERETYHFAAEDGSAFIVWPGGLFSSAKREFVSGPRQGQMENITGAEVEQYRKRAEEEWGKYVPKTWSSPPRFIPGSKRKSIPWTIDQNGIPVEAGWIDEKGPHRHPYPLVPYI